MCPLQWKISLLLNLGIHIKTSQIWQTAWIWNMESQIYLLCIIMDHFCFLFAFPIEWMRKIHSSALELISRCGNTDLLYTILRLRSTSILLLQTLRAALRTPLTTGSLQRSSRSSESSSPRPPFIPPSFNRKWRTTCMCLWGSRATLATLQWSLPLWQDACFQGSPVSPPASPHAAGLVVKAGRRPDSVS